MRVRRVSAIVILMSVVSFAQQPAAAPAAVTDPKQIVSKQKTDLQKLSIEKLYMTRAIGGTTWSPDGKTIAFISNISGRNNLWTVPADGGWPTQLTINNQRQTRPAWSPDGRWIAYMQDYDGDEQWDIWIVSPTSGEIVNLTNTRDTAEENPVWSPDGRELAFITKPKTSPTFEINVLDMVTKRVRHITSDTPKDWGNFNPVWSHDGAWLAFTQQHAAGKDSNIIVTDSNGDRRMMLTPHSGEKEYFAVAWTQTNDHLLIGSNAGNGYQNVGILDVHSKQIEWLTSEKWEVTPGVFSPDGNKVFWTTNVDGNENIFVYDRASRTAQPLAMPKGVNSLGGSNGSNSPWSNERLLVYHNGPDSPNDVWVYDLKSNEARQVTHSLVAGVRGQDMVEPSLVHYPSKDGKFQISAFVYMPYNQQKDHRTPAIVYIHGGPSSQTVNSFNRIVQYLLNEGYAVIAPNYRGSTGYGKEFHDANRFDMGGGDLQDVLAAADWIKQSDYIDPNKLIIMGGSYGGYMTMMGLTKAPLVWAAGVAIVPFVNWFTEVENEDPLLREYDLATMGDPVKNKALWDDRSPINFVDKIKAPVFLLAGGNDPRCPQSEAQQVASAIEKKGGTAVLKIYENEGHGFAKIENQIDAYKRVADFLKSHVPAMGCGCTIYE